MLNVYLLRHGQTQYNADGNKYCGRTDIPLTALGIEQAYTVRQQLKDVSFDAVYASPLERAYHTAQTIIGDAPVIKDERLIEADFGAWEGRTKEELIESDESLWINWLNDPLISRAGGTGETAQEVIDRVNAFYESVQVQHTSGTILIVAHNVVNRFYLAYKLGIDIKNYRKLIQENAAITMFQLDEHKELTLYMLNSRAML